MSTNLSSRLENLESELQMLLRLYQVQSPAVNGFKCQSFNKKPKKLKSVDEKESAKCLNWNVDLSNSTSLSSCTNRTMSKKKDPPSSENKMNSAEPLDNNKKQHYNIIQNYIESLKQNFKHGDPELAKSKMKFKKPAVTNRGLKNVAKNYINEMQTANKLSHNITTHENTYNDLGSTPSLSALIQAFAQSELNSKTPNSINNNAIQDLSSQLESERKKCLKAEETVGRLQEILDINHSKVLSLQEDKELALSIAKELRDKYERIRKSRKSAIDEIEELRRQNHDLQLKLKAQEMNKDTEKKETALARQSHEALKKASLALKMSNERLLKSLQHTEGNLKESDLSKETMERTIFEMQERIQKSEGNLRKCELEIRKREKSYEALQKQATIHKDLKEKCDKLEVALKLAQDSDAKHCASVEMEITKMRDVMEKKQKTQEEEREETRILITDLSKTIKKHKERIKQLTDIVYKQDTIIKSQSNDLKNREQQLEMAVKHADTMQNRADTLEKQLEEVKVYLEESLHKQDDIAELQKNVRHAKSEAEAARDSLLMKDKIIDDQMNTISDLKTTLEYRTEELRQVILERDKERAKYISAASDLQLTRNKANNLLQKISSEQSLTCYENEKRLSEMEIAVKTNNKRMAEKFKTLLGEKKKAVQAAQYVTKKLVDTVDEFDKQVIAQKKVNKMLISVLINKEKKLAAANHLKESLTQQLSEKDFLEEKKRQEVLSKAYAARDACLEVLKRMTTEESECN